MTRKSAAATPAADPTKEMPQWLEVGDGHPRALVMEWTDSDGNTMLAVRSWNTDTAGQLFLFTKAIPVALSLDREALKAAVDAAIAEARAETPHETPPAEKG